MKFVNSEQNCSILPDRRKDRLADGWTDRRAEMTKLIFALLNYAKAPNNSTFFAQSVFMCFVCISGKTATLAGTAVSKRKVGMCLLSGTNWVFK